MIANNSSFGNSLGTWAIFVGLVTAAATILTILGKHSAVDNVDDGYDGLENTLGV